MSVKRIYVEKKAEYAVQARKELNEIHDFLGLDEVTGIRLLIRYDMENISDVTYEAAKGLIFSEPPVDILYEGTFPRAEGAKVFSVESLPGQFDQRADSAEQCVKLLNEAEEPIMELVPKIDLIDADAERIQVHLEKLMEVEDPTGSEGELTIAAYITEQMKALGYTVEGQAFHEGFLNVNGIDAPGVNLIAERGADTQEGRTRDIFLVVTHYDSKTVVEEGDPYANDKSGVVVLLEAARILAQEETDTDLCFLSLQRGR